MHLFRFKYILTTSNIAFTFLLFILCPISCCHLPYFPATCNISLYLLPLKMVVFYYLRQHPVVYSFHFPYINTTGNNFAYFLTLHFMFHIIIPLAIVPGLLPYFIEPLTINNYCIFMLTVKACCACLRLSIYSYHCFFSLSSLHTTSHILLPLAIVPWQLPFFIGSLTSKKYAIYYLLKFSVVPVYCFLHFNTTSNIRLVSYF